MEARERRRNDRPAGQGAGPGDGGRLGELRREAQSHLDAVDETIARTLSGDSEAFVQASRQTGGQ